jgi:hypothetical protein
LYWRKTMQQVEVRIRGQLDKKWEDWLEGFAISYSSEDETVLTGKLIDQASLYGLMGKLRDMGVKLVSVVTTEAGDE